MKRSIHNTSIEEELAFGPKFKSVSSAESQVDSCAIEALNRGVEVFVVTNDGCRGYAHTGLNFVRHGRTDSCGDSTIGESNGRVYGRGGKKIKN